jgi:2-amino-4-hydroxy-6-hydroxymethyldihydropteridine diphosphokinase
MDLDCTAAYLLLGTNMGDRMRNLETAISYLQAEVGEVFITSGVYETAAWGKTDQPGFLNQALGVYSTLAPFTLLQTILEIERKMGRVRFEKWGQRLIDIDIIFYADLVLDEKDLKVPHPEMHHRRFVLEPLNEIAQNFVHPVFKENISNILGNLTDDLTVERI